MKKTDFENAKDRVRERLNKFTVKAFQMIPEMDKPRILDVGCGSGVPTLKLAELSNGHITALDIDQNVIDSLKRKIKEYFFPMQKLINETRSKCAGDGNMLALMDKEQKEIEVFKTDPASCCSVFFVMRKR